MQATQVCYIPYPSSKTNNSNWLAIFKFKPHGWTDENDPQKDVAFQEDEVESNEIIIPSEADTDNSDHHGMSSTGSDNENNIDEEGEIHKDNDDGIHDNEGSYEYSTSSNKDEEDEEEEEEDND
ncbi:hypothetical protein Lser_V15G37724 [Lactuca serriola]